MKGKLTDDEVIQGIVHAVARAPKGAVLGSMQLVRASGLPYGAKHQATSRARIIRLIPEAVDGSHGDLVVALAQAVWGLGRWGGATFKPAKVAPAPDSIEARKAALRKPPPAGQHWLDRRLGR